MIIIIFNYTFPLKTILSIILINCRSERIEKKKLDSIAQNILTTTHQQELLVMGYFNGSVQFFGITAKLTESEQSKWSLWLEKIPGVRTVKKWSIGVYNKGKHYFHRE